MGMICHLSAMTNEEIDQLLENPESVEDLLEELEEFEDYLSLDKSWDGIHFLLNATESPNNETLRFLYEGGESVGEIDVGYGPARVMKYEFVCNLKDALDDVSEEELKSRFNPQKMTEVYPSIWDREAELESNREWLLVNIRSLREFLSKAKEYGMGMMVWLT